MRWPRRHRPRGRHRRQTWLHRHPAAIAEPAALPPADPPALELAPGPSVAPVPVAAPPRGVELVYADGSVLVLDPGSTAFERLRATADQLRAARD